MASFAGILLIGFLIFRRNLIVSKHTKNDLEELKAEFEEYRKQSRLAREKMSMDHFNEIRRLRARRSEHRTQPENPFHTHDAGPFEYPETEAQPKPVRRIKSHKTGNDTAPAESPDNSPENSHDRATEKSPTTREDAAPETTDNTELKTREYSSAKTQESDEEISEVKKTTRSTRKKKVSGKTKPDGGQNNLDL